MTITPITKVRAAVERALQLSPDREAALAAAAQAQGLAVEVVREAVEGVEA
jgi:hypothetical protein